MVSALASINVVNRHLARLLIGWVTACEPVKRQIASVRMNMKSISDHLYFVNRGKHLCEVGDMCPRYSV